MFREDSLNEFPPMHMISSMQYGPKENIAKFSSLSYESHRACRVKEEN